MAEKLQGREVTFAEASQHRPLPPIAGCPEAAMSDVHPRPPEPAATRRRLAAMRRTPLLAVSLAAIFALAACTSTGGGVLAGQWRCGAIVTGREPGSSPDSPVSSSPGAVDPGGGVVVPPDEGVIPQPGQLDVHPVRAEKITAAVDGRHVVLTIAWTSGVAPCNVLDSIVVDKGTGTFAITLREGASRRGVMCIEIAKRYTTHVDLGDLEPGTYTITDGQGGAPAIEVVIA